MINVSRVCVEEVCFVWGVWVWFFIFVVCGLYLDVFLWYFWRIFEGFLKVWVVVLICTFYSGGCYRFFWVLGVSMVF